MIYEPWVTPDLEVVTSDAAHWLFTVQVKLRQYGPESLLEKLVIVRMLPVLCHREDPSISLALPGQQPHLAFMAAVAGARQRRSYGRPHPHHATCSDCSQRHGISHAANASGRGHLKRLQCQHRRNASPRPRYEGLRQAT